MSRIAFSLAALTTILGATAPTLSQPSNPDQIAVSRTEYVDQLEGFWLGQCIANWTGLVTEMDKIGGDGPAGRF